MVAFLLCLIVAASVKAGWYTCYTFKGVIGTYPIHLSIQLLPGYSGNPKAMNIKGVYVYDTFNNPIELDGLLETGNHAVIKELAGKQPAAVFDFILSGNSIKGSWRSLKTGKSLPLQLEKTGELVDTTDASVIPPIEILQSASLKNKYLVGVYSKTALESRAHMDKLKIIDKATNIVFQEIDFSKVETATGNVWTIIYGNTMVEDSNKDGYPDITVWNNIGKMGGYLYITGNPATGRFTLNPEPELDGPKE